ncbi:MAG: exopolysaccharide biosynthesis polyprenyl glycosylphosphotransferase [Desulfomicrobiaceae bacterium]|nr:exopolysaccharide biosynthesis polyprenyl glycosylphosphotransferase [Desulfomicrobiaceae bacterium]
MTRRPLPPLTTSLVLLAADTLSLLVACWTAVLVRRALGGAFPLALYAEVTPFVLLFPGLFALQGLYPGTLIAPADALKRLCQSISLGFALLVVLSFFAKHGPLYSRGVMAMAWGASLAAVPLARALVRRFCLRQGRWGQAAVLVGADASTAQLEATLHAHPELGITPVARMDPSGARTQGALPPPRQGVAILLVEPGQVEALLDGPLAGFGRVLLAPQLPALPSLWTDTADVAGTLLVDVRMKLLDPRRQRLKRLLDLAVTLAALPLALPLMAAIALAVRLTSPGPVFFAHRRIGRGGRDIRIWKFRTMHPEADRLLAEALKRDPALRQQWEACHKLRHDPRITRVGGFLRRTSLDELPQLWNVLCGDLALVGPRPIVWDEVPKYGETGFALYCKVRPGLTGLWQVSGRSTTTYAERVALDAYYVRNWSVWLDLYILARTPAALVRVHQSW